jgi:hypothetical protein
MENRMRLDSVSTKLREALSRATEGQRRQAVLKACLLATSSSGLSGGEVDTAIELLRQGIRSDFIRRRLETLSEHLDEEYLDLRDAQSDTQIGVEALARFNKARAASALAFALSADPDVLCECIYEAIMALLDRAKVIEALETTLAMES